MGSHQDPPGGKVIIKSKRQHWGSSSFMERGYDASSLAMLFMPFRRCPSVRHGTGGSPRAADVEEVPLSSPRGFSPLFTPLLYKVFIVSATPSFFYGIWFSTVLNSLYLLSRCLLITVQQHSATYRLIRNAKISGPSPDLRNQNLNFKKLLRFF